MPPYKAIFVARSDGQSFTKLENGRSEANAPTPDQLSKELKADSKTGTKCYDYYRKLSPKDAKHIDWRWKLGAMWAKQRGTEEMKRNPTDYILADLPEHYILYEHIKTKPDDGKTALKTKTHAGGGHDRQDAYLYGYPAGRRKRYRSPAEFIHHLLFLTDDNATDWRDCACKFCAPDDIQPKREKEREVGVFKGVVIHTGAPPAGAQPRPQSTGPLAPSVIQTAQQISRPASTPAVSNPTSQPTLQPRPANTVAPIQQGSINTYTTPQQASYTQPPRAAPPNMSIQPWLDPETEDILQRVNPQVSHLYKNILQGRWQGEDRAKAVRLVNDELKRLVALGMTIPNQTRQAMQQVYLATQIQPSGFQPMGQQQQQNSGYVGAAQAQYGQQYQQGGPNSGYTQNDGF